MSSESKLLVMKKHIVILTAEEEKSCRSIISRGQNKAEVIRRAYILLKSHDGKTDVEIARDLYIDDETVRRTRLRFCAGGLQAALESKTAPGNEARLDENQQAHLTALACSPCPSGRANWTGDLLAQQLIADGIVESISASTVNRYLKKTCSSPGE